MSLICKCVWGLYRRLSTLQDAVEVDGFAAELTDRFGSLPSEVHHLLEIVKIKVACRVGWRQLGQCRSQRAHLSLFTKIHRPTLRA